MHRRKTRSRKTRKNSRRSRGSPRSRSTRKSTKGFTRIGRSPIQGKKYRAYFKDGTHTDFGAVGYSDYTKHKDPARRQRYLSRHKRHENWGASGCKTAGSLSRHILWGSHTNLRDAVAAYKRRCG